MKDGTMTHLRNTSWGERKCDGFDQNCWDVTKVIYVKTGVLRKCNNSEKACYNS